jgi:hypothetical protein
MPLFDPSTAPCGDRPKRYSESIYTYYRNSERASMIAIRALLEAWFDELPLHRVAELIAFSNSPLKLGLACHRRIKFKKQYKPIKFGLNPLLEQPMNSRKSI